MKKVFLLGNPRSGTSLLRIMLNSHPKIVSPPECGFLHWWYAKYKDWDKKKSSSQEKVEYFVEDVLQSKKIETWNLEQESLVKAILDRTPSNYAQLCLIVYLEYARIRKSEPEVIVDKNNYYIHHLDVLEKIWPDALYIHLIRDGRDVACSYLDVKELNSTSPYKPKLSTNISEIAQEWNLNNLHIERFVNRRPVEERIKVRYEDLVSEPEDSLKNLCKLLEIPFSSKMLNYFLYNDEPRSTSDWKLKTFKKPDKQNIGRYKNKLTESEISQFNIVAEESLKRSGYL